MKKCSKCQTLKPATDFSKNKRQSDGLQWICKLCNKKRCREYYNQNRTHCLAANKNRKDAAIKKCQVVVSIFREPGCFVCSEKCPDVLDAHHINKHEKDKEVGCLVHDGNMKKLLIELKKCVPLCANCHRKLHANYFSLLIMEPVRVELSIS